MWSEPRKKQIPIKKIDLEGTNIVKDVQTATYTPKAIRQARQNAIIGTFNSNGAANALRYGGDITTTESSTKSSYSTFTKDMAQPVIAKRGSQPTRVR